MLYPPELDNAAELPSQELAVDGHVEIRCAHDQQWHIHVENVVDACVTQFEAHPAVPIVALDAGHDSVYGFLLIFSSQAATEAFVQQLDSKLRNNIAQPALHQDAGQVQVGQV